MPGYIDIHIVGDDAGVQYVLNRMNQSLEVGMLSRWLLSEVDPFLRARAADRFASEGDDVVGGWLPLSPYTENIRRSRGYGAAHPINVRTGQLRDYILNSPSTVGPNGTGATLTYPGSKPGGSLADKVRVAQQGNPRNPVTPPRPVLGVNLTDLEYVLGSLADHIARVVTT